MIGTGWLVMVATWWDTAGRTGAFVAFGVGGLALLPVAVTYSRLVADKPASVAELAYGDGYVPTWAAFAGSWAALLAYGTVCPWEAIQVGRIGATLLPGLAMPIYSVADAQVTVGHILFGLTASGLLAVIQLRGLSWVVWVQQAAIGLLAAVVLITVLCAAVAGDVGKLSRGEFAGRAPIAAVLALLTQVPFFLAGFEAAGKAADERREDTSSLAVGSSSTRALLIGATFYVVVLASLALVASDKPTKVFLAANEVGRATGKRWVAHALLAVGMLSLFKCFNASLLATSRIGRGIAQRGLLPSAFAELTRHGVPAKMILCTTAITGILIFGGPAFAGPLAEVSSLFFVVAWLVACASAWRRFRQPGTRAWAGAGMVVCVLLAGVTIREWIRRGARLEAALVLGAFFGLAGLLAKTRPSQTAPVRGDGLP
jgi:amino acid transporter